MPPPRPAAAAVAVALAALATAGCITRTVHETVLDQPGMTVILRGEKRGTTPVEQGYAHPFTIAGVRLAHILSRIDLEDDSGKKRERRPAVSTESLYPIADALAKGLARADSTQQVLIQAVHRTKRLGVFDRYFLTSLLAWAKGDVLYIQVGRSDWEIPKRRRDDLPEPAQGEHPQSFRLLVDQGMSLVDPQCVAVEWRAPIFAKATRTRIMPSGQVQRRNILMESPEEAEPPSAAPAMPTDLTPEQLRALADLEEARRAGRLSEAQYTSERGRILSGAQGQAGGAAGSSAPGATGAPGDGSAAGPQDGGAR
jgi:hypothetical protein